MRLRSANRGNANNTWNVNSTGYLNNNNAYNSNRCAPDCVSQGTDGLSAGQLLPDTYTQGAEFPAGRRTISERRGQLSGAGTAISAMNNIRGITWKK